MELTTLYMLLAVAVAAVAIGALAAPRLRTAVLGENGDFNVKWAMITAVSVALLLAVGGVVWGIASDTMESVDADYAEDIGTDDFGDANTSGN